MLIWSVIVICLALQQGGGAAPSDAEIAEALADARGQLNAAVEAWPIGGRFQIKDLLDESTRRSDVALLTSDAVPIGTARKYADGVTEVHLTLEFDRLAARLGALLERRGLDRGVIEPHIQQIREQAKTESLTFAGFALPPVEDETAPYGWEGLGGAAVALAAESAMLDARRRLVDASASVALASGRRLADVYEARPDVEERLIAALPLDRFEPAHYTIERGCTVTCRMNSSEIVRLVGEMVNGPGKHEPIELREAEDAPSELAVTGEGVLPGGQLMERLGLGAPDMRPAWADRCLIVHGSVSALTTRPAGADDRAAAEADAIRQLAERIDELIVRPGVSVRGVREADPAVSAGLRAFLAGADRLGPAPDPAGQTVVTLRTPLRRVWHLVRERSDRATADEGKR